MDKSVRVSRSGECPSGGKHKGRPLSEVVDEDPVFCQWILREAQASIFESGIWSLKVSSHTVPHVASASAER